MTDEPRDEEPKTPKPPTKTWQEIANPPKGKPRLAPRYVQVIVRPFRQLKTKGGIHVPESAQSASVVLCRVVAVGQGRLTDKGKLVPLRVEPGDVVIPLGAPCPVGIDPNTHDGTRGAFPWEGERLSIMFEQDLGPTVEDPEELIKYLTEGYSEEEIEEHEALMEASASLQKPMGPPIALMDRKGKAQPRRRK